MKDIKISVTLLALVALLSACGNNESAPEGNTESQSVAAVNNTKVISFVDTQEGKPLEIDHALFDTPAAKEFLATGKNPYVGDEEAIASGKKVFGLYSCTQCHGPTAQGQVGPGLVGPTFKYPKNATNKGMFETIWNGTNGGMGGKGKGIMTPTDGMTPDEILKVIAWVRTQGSEGVTGNE
jgi:cytochrome c-L